MRFDRATDWPHVVVTDLPTHTQVLDSSTAVLVSPTAEGLAQGVLSLLQQPFENRRRWFFDVANTSAPTETA